MNSDSATLFQQGVDLFELRDWADAIAVLDQVIQHQPTHDAAWCCKALCQGHLQQLEASLTSFDQALAINPSNLRALENKGILLVQMERPKEA
ncbi:MAG: hypothetical protein LH647_23580, partial [Leptolyngbyaceae cyanobacterium CAN_BIN12]|nr:hypothetical protein [Leptolyngbyaceae cyanobacterium CAN_BIN12]